MKTIAVYPGSFDPITFGHLDIIERSLKFVDKLIIGVGSNPSKNYLFSAQERVDIITHILKDKLSEDKHQQVSVLKFNNLLIDFAKQQQAGLIIRGIRALSDFDFEFNLAGVNYKLSPEIETTFLIATEKHQFISSKFVKEIAAFKGDISKFVPSYVMQKLAEKYHN